MRPKNDVHTLDCGACRTCVVGCWSVCHCALVSWWKRQAASWWLHDSRGNIARAENGKLHRSCSPTKDGLVVEIDGGITRRTVHILMNQCEKKNLVQKELEPFGSYSKTEKGFNGVRRDKGENQSTPHLSCIRIPSYSLKLTDQQHGRCIDFFISFHSFLAACTIFEAWASSQHLHRMSWESVRRYDGEAIQSIKLE